MINHAQACLLLDLSKNNATSLRLDFFKLYFWVNPKTRNKGVFRPITSKKSSKVSYFHLYFHCIYASKTFGKKLFAWRMSSNEKSVRHVRPWPFSQMIFDKAASTAAYFWAVWTLIAHKWLTVFLDFFKFYFWITSKNKTTNPKIKRPNQSRNVTHIYW